MQDEVATVYKFEEDSISAEEKLDSPDTVDGFTTTPTNDKDVGGAFAGPGKLVEVFRDAINKLKVK